MRRAILVVTAFFAVAFISCSKKNEPLIEIYKIAEAASIRVQKLENELTEQNSAISAYTISEKEERKIIDKATASITKIINDNGEIELPFIQKGSFEKFKVIKIYLAGFSWNRKQSPRLSLKAIIQSNSEINSFLFDTWDFVNKKGSIISSENVFLESGSSKISTGDVSYALVSPEVKAFKDFDIIVIP